MQLKIYHNRGQLLISRLTGHVELRMGTCPITAFTRT